jgi:hypothetical protein
MHASGQTISVVRGGTLRLSVTGFKSGTVVAVWGHSTPVLLTQATAKSNGMVGKEFVLPAAMAPGEHTLIAIGTVENGQPASMTVGIVVTDTVAQGSTGAHGENRVAPQQGLGANWWWLVSAVAFAMILALFLFIVWRRRQKDGGGGGDQRRMALIHHESARRTAMNRVCPPPVGCIQPSALNAALDAT